MLNLWRRAWRKDTCIKTPSTQNESPHTPSGTENVVGRKRSRSPTEIIQNTNSARPKKKPKPEKDSISLHLPEFLVQTHGFASAPFASANIDEVGIARHALEHNSAFEFRWYTSDQSYMGPAIAIVPSAKGIVNIYVRYATLNFLFCASNVYDHGGLRRLCECRRKKTTSRLALYACNSRVSHSLQIHRTSRTLRRDAGSVSGSVAQIRTQLPDLNLSETVDETANQTRNVVVSSANVCFRIRSICACST